MVFVILRWNRGGDREGKARQHPSNWTRCRSRENFLIPFSILKIRRIIKASATMMTSSTGTWWLKAIGGDQDGIVKAARCINNFVHW